MVKLKSLDSFCGTSLVTNLRSAAADRLTND
jgi:hypothetical protein